jgi:hypothetical protein
LKGTSSGVCHRARSRLLLPLLSWYVPPKRQSTLRTARHHLRSPKTENRILGCSVHNSFHYCPSCWYSPACHYLPALSNPGHLLLIQVVVIAPHRNVMYIVRTGSRRPGHA